MSSESATVLVALLAAAGFGKTDLASSPGVLAASSAQVAIAKVATLLEWGGSEFTRSGVLGEGLLVTADAGFSGFELTGVAAGLLAVEAEVAASIFRKLAGPRPVEL